METGTAPAPGPRFTLVDTASAPPRERFDLWCSLFPFTDMAPLRRTPYQSSAMLYADQDGSMLARIHMDATLSDFPEARSDQIMFNLFLGGRSLVRHGGHEDVVDAGSGFNLMDCRMPMRTIAQQHESIHLLLPRAQVVPLLGQLPAGDGRALRHLPQTPLGQILQSHLITITDHAMALDAEAAAHAMASVKQLALACLAQFSSNDDTPDTDTALFDGACRYIEARLDDPVLSVERIAQALECSRSRLYRIFAAHGLTIASHARSLRLARGRHLLRTTRMNTGDVAQHCGYGDLPAFSKAFRREYGLSPGEWRNEAARD